MYNFPPMMKKEPNLTHADNQWHREQQRKQQFSTVYLAIETAILNAYPQLQNENTVRYEFHQYLLHKLNIKKLQSLLAQPGNEQNVQTFRRMLCAELRRINFTRELAKTSAIRATMGMPSRQLKQHLNHGLIQFEETSEIPNDIRLELGTNAVNSVAFYVQKYPLLFVRF